MPLGKYVEPCRAEWGWVLVGNLNAELFSAPHRLDECTLNTWFNAFGLLLILFSFYYPMYVGCAGWHRAT